MSEERKFSNEELHRYLEELPDLLIDGGEPIDGRFPDGTMYDFDDDLNATIENTPDGKRYIVEYKKGQGLVRIKEVDGGVGQLVISERSAS
jgi:hypothetical protein